MSAKAKNCVNVAMIQLGLGRIARLLEHNLLPWRAVHVAGTNGKGSVCAYASAMLNAARIKCGRFTSPHLVDRWDCIQVGGKTIDESLFREAEAKVKAKDKVGDIRASEFELLTATAFEIFAKEKVEVGVIEVGMGGKLDATNIIKDPLVTVITKIGLDHQAFLGNTLETIAHQKAGIMKPGAPCIVDGTNAGEVVEILRASAEGIGAMPFICNPQDMCDEDSLLWSTLRKEDFEIHQQNNINLAFEAVKQVVSRLRPSVEPQRLLYTILDTALPGRLQMLSMEPITGRQEKVLLDGAHNIQSAEVLYSYVSHKIRRERFPVTWVVAFSEGKDMQQILSSMVKSHDNMVAVEFGAVDGMPWVQAAAVDEILRVARSIGVHGQIHNALNDLELALRLATGESMGGPLVVAGSLYLVSDFLRMLRRYSKS